MTQSQSSSLSTSPTLVGDDDDNISSTSKILPQDDENKIQEPMVPEVLTIEQTPQSPPSSTTSSRKNLVGEYDGDHGLITESSAQAGEDKVSKVLEQESIVESELEPEEPQHAEVEVQTLGSFPLTEEEDGNKDFMEGENEPEFLIDPEPNNIAEPEQDNEEPKQRSENNSTSLTKKEPEPKNILSQVQQWIVSKLRLAHSLPHLKDIWDGPQSREIQIVCRDFLKVLRIPAIIVLAILGFLSFFILCLGLRVPGILEFDTSYPFESSFMMCTLETLSAIYVCSSVKWCLQDPRATLLDMIAIIWLFTLLITGYYQPTLSSYFCDDPEYFVGLVTLNVAVLVIFFLWNLLSVRKHLDKVYRLAHLGLKEALKKVASSLHRKDAFAQKYLESEDRAAILVINAPKVLQSSDSNGCEKMVLLKM